MSELIPFATAAAVAFSFLLLVPLALSAGLWAASRLLGAATAAPGRAELKANVKFAALWSLCGFVPLAALARSAAPAALYSWAFAGFAAVAFVLAIRSPRLAADPVARRLAWAGLEALLVAQGFLLFEGTFGLARVLGTAAS